MLVLPTSKAVCTYWHSHVPFKEFFTDTASADTADWGDRKEWNSN